MKKIRIFLIILIVCVCFCCRDVFASTKVNTRIDGNYLVPSDVIITESNKQAILSTPAIDASEKIYDFADLLSVKEEETLYRQVKHFIDSTGIDYVIVTINKNNKAGLKEYARDFYNYNDFLDDGIIFLIDRDNKGIYMTTNGSAVNLFPDSRMEPILKNVYNLTKEKKFYEACKSFTISISEFVQIGIVTDDEGVVKVGTDGKVKIFKKLHVLEVSIFALVGTLVIIVVLILKSRIVKKAIEVREFLNRDTMKIVNISEIPLESKIFKALLSREKSNNKNLNQDSTGIKK